MIYIAVDAYCSIWVCFLISNVDMQPIGLEISIAEEITMKNKCWTNGFSILVFYPFIHSYLGYFVVVVEKAAIIE